MQTGVPDQLDGTPVFVGDARKSRLDALHAQVVERASDGELLLRIEHYADGLLAVPQGRIVEADGAADVHRLVEASRPDALAHCADSRPARSNRLSAADE
jgi:hypothetical protein